MRTFTTLILAFMFVAAAWANTPIFIDHNGQEVYLKTASWSGEQSSSQGGSGTIRDLRNGNYAIACQTENGTYLQNMLNYVYSPEIAIPAGNSVLFDFFVRGSFGDPDVFPEVDYWGCELTVDGGSSWFYISNPYGDPDGTNYVYSDAPADWSSFVQSYTVDGILDDYAGMTIQFRFYFQSDEDTPQGEGIFLDDISLDVDGASAFFEDFEDGNMDGWVSEDGTATPPMWHQTTVNAYDGQSWAMNDPELGNSGGYLDHWYQTLDSPALTLPTGGGNTLTFMQNRNIEGTAGAEPPYDGWDGTNVRISNDTGVTWEVLTNPTPAYNSTSMYSFGFEFNEGAGIPGWGGVSPGWEAVSFPIPASYDGQEVMIRWAFASDPAYSTPDDPTMFGWVIDDIDVAGVLTNDGETNEGWVAASQVPIAGDLWHVAFVAELPAPISLEVENGDEQVDVNWAAPITGTIEDIAYDTGAFAFFISDAQPYAVVFDVAEDGTYLKEAKLYMYSTATFTGPVDAFVYSVDPEGLPNELLYTVEDLTVEAYPAPTVANLASAGLIFDAGDQFALAVGNFLDNGTQGVLAEQDTTISPPSGHSYVWGGDTWYPITEAYDDISNVGIRAEVVLPGEGFTPESYNVYRRQEGYIFGDPISAAQTALAYTDYDVVNGTVYYYAVSANYSFGESPLSEEVMALPESQSVYELGYDDGTAEFAFNLGSGNYQAVKLTPDGYPTLLKRMKIFIHDENPGNIIAYIWDDDGDGGMPLGELKRFGWSGLQPGWNIYDLSDDLIWIEDGSFYVGLKEVTSTPGIGADDSDYSGFSYYDAGEGWDNMGNLLSYNLMMRADADSAFVTIGVDQVGTQLPTEYSLKQNYPNPFNPSTEINYAIKEAGMVRLAIYDLSGREVDVVVDEHQSAGIYRLTLDGSYMSSGIYLYTLTAGDTRISRKMILLK